MEVIICHIYKWNRLRDDKQCAQGHVVSKSVYAHTYKVHVCHNENFPLYHSEKW
jgi:hypothetical protein